MIQCIQRGKIRTTCAGNVGSSSPPASKQTHLCQELSWWQRAVQLSGRAGGLGRPVQIQSLQASSSPQFSQPCCLPHMNTAAPAGSSPILGPTSHPNEHRGRGRGDGNLQPHWQGLSKLGPLGSGPCPCAARRWGLQSAPGSALQRVVHGTRPLEPDHLGSHPGTTTYFT